jgi:hypothetical protein
VCQGAAGCRQERCRGTSGDMAVCCASGRFIASRWGTVSTSTVGTFAAGRCDTVQHSPADLSRRCVVGWARVCVVGVCGGWRPLRKNLAGERRFAGNESETVSRRGTAAAHWCRSKSQGGRGNTTRHHVEAHRQRTAPRCMQRCPRKVGMRGPHKAWRFLTAVSQTTIQRELAGRGDNRWSGESPRQIDVTVFHCLLCLSS